MKKEHLSDPRHISRSLSAPWYKFSVKPKGLRWCPESGVPVSGPHGLTPHYTQLRIAVQLLFDF